MGIYVNPGNTAFKEALNSMIYVDKSGLISYTNSVLNTKQKNLCVSRPRRFGKSMAADMLVAYYSKGCDSEELFTGLKISEESSCKHHMNRHCLIRLDVQRFLETKQDLDNFIDKIEGRVIAELSEEFPKCCNFNSEERLKDVLDRIFIQTKNGFIFIIDEWDCVFRMAKEREDIQKKYLDFLRGLFKGAEYVELAYMTGILPIKKDGAQSAISDFKEFTVVKPRKFGGYVGFTEEEVEGLCKEFQSDFAMMKQWYDGYSFRGVGSVYNPNSVIEAIRNDDFDSYWTQTSAAENLMGYISLNFDGLSATLAKLLEKSGWNSIRQSGR